jgi:hypothetical protein
MPFLIDTFFAGHAAWTLFLLVIAATMAVAPPQYWWFLITRFGIGGIVLVIGWSAYVDVCYFRYVCGARLTRAIGDVVLHRLVAWTLIFWIFAVPDSTPLGVIQEIVRAMAEVAAVIGTARTVAVLLVGLGAIAAGTIVDAPVPSAVRTIGGYHALAGDFHRPQLSVNVVHVVADRHRVSKHAIADWTSSR